MSKRIVWGIAAVLILAAAGAAWRFLVPRRPHYVFLIVVDTLRADRLSCYGYDGHHTPHVDALAARGALFENAMSVGSWTVPSMGAMMTSLYPTQLGLVEAPTIPHFFRWKERREQIEYTIPLDFVTMAEVYRDAGYRTSAFVNQPTLNARDGFAQGFAEWFYPVVEDTVVRRDASTPLTDLDHTAQRRATWEETSGADSSLVATFTAWMDTVSTRDRRFVWIHLFTPHRPYRPPARYAPVAPPDSSHGDRMQRLSAKYDGEVRFADELVGDVLASIDRRVGLDRSLVVFTADHGEEFGEHGREEHGHSLYRECVHVPLVFAGPGLPGGVRSAPYVRLIDVLPTMLDVCRLSGDAPAYVEGVSLEPRMCGGGDDLDVYSEAMLYGSSKRSLIDGGFRLVWNGQDDTTQLFRVADDPGETVDVTGRFAAESARLTGQLVSTHRRLVEGYRQFLGVRAEVDSATAAADRERTLKAMKSLGYVGD